MFKGPPNKSIHVINYTLQCVFVIKSLIELQFKRWTLFRNTLDSVLSNAKQVLFFFIKNCLCALNLMHNADKLTISFKWTKYIHLISINLKINLISIGDKKLIHNIYMFTHKPTVQCLWSLQKSIWHVLCICIILLTSSWSEQNYAMDITHYQIIDNLSPKDAAWTVWGSWYQRCRAWDWKALSSITDQEGVSPNFSSVSVFFHWFQFHDLTFLIGQFQSRGLAKWDWKPQMSLISLRSMLVKPATDIA